MRRLLRALLWLVVLLVVAAAAVYATLGGGLRRPAAPTQPRHGPTARETVGDRSDPPGPARNGARPVAIRFAPW